MDGPGIRNAGEESLWQDGGDAHFVSACMYLMLVFKNGKKLVAVSSAVIDRSSNMMLTGDRCIRITFGACILIKEKSMEAAPSTGGSTARKIPTTFTATQLLLKNTKPAEGKGSLSR